MSLCPSCGWRVEGGETCPRCGASLKRRLPWRVLQYGALLVAMGGLALLLYAARGTPVTHLDIGAIGAAGASLSPARADAHHDGAFGAAQNLAYVEISGVVTQPTTYNPEAQTLAFRVDDGTGEMLVSAFKNETMALVKGGHVPALGDHVTVQGTLRLREDFAALTLNLAEALKLERPTPLALTIGAINSDLALQPVEVSARVVSTREPYAGLTLITLQDETGEIDAALDETTRLLTGNPPKLAPGDRVRLSGVVELFKGTPQITLITSQSIEFLPPDTALADNLLEPEAVTPIVDVRVGAAAKVEGEVKSVESFSSGFSFVLEDGSGPVALALRDRVYQKVVGVEGLRVGARVRAFGLTTIFNGTLQIAPEQAEDVTIVTAGKPAEAVTAIREIGLAQVGQVLTIGGKVVAVNPFSEGTRLTVDDGTGTSVVLIWESVLGYVPEVEWVAVGQSARVTGQVAQFQGTIEIVPQIGFDVILE